jgi:hypothetical protein
MADDPGLKPAGISPNRQGLIADTFFHLLSQRQRKMQELDAAFRGSNLGANGLNERGFIHRRRKGIARKHDTRTRF